jgi:hypothetical protein
VIVEAAKAREKTAFRRFPPALLRRRESIGGDAGQERLGLRILSPAFSLEQP